jgi:hypothetical protein
MDSVLLISDGRSSLSVQLAEPEHDADCERAFGPDHGQTAGSPDGIVFPIVFLVLSIWFSIEGQIREWFYWNAELESSVIDRSCRSTPALPRRTSGSPGCSNKRKRGMKPMSTTRRVIGTAIRHAPCRPFKMSTAMSQAGTTAL